MGLRRLTLTDVRPDVAHYLAKAGNAGGGSLHNVLMDGNIRDSDIEACQRFAWDDEDIDGVYLAAALLKLTKTQRKKLCR